MFFRIPLTQQVLYNDLIGTTIHVKGIKRIDIVQPTCHLHGVIILSVNFVTFLYSSHVIPNQENRINDNLQSNKEETKVIDTDNYPGI